MNRFDHLVGWRHSGSNKVGQLRTHTPTGISVRKLGPNQWGTLNGYTLNWNAVRGCLLHVIRVVPCFRDTTPQTLFANLVHNIYQPAQRVAHHVRYTRRNHTVYVYSRIQLPAIAEHIELDITVG